MFTRSNFELKVGIFIFIGIVILSVIVFSIGNFYSVKRGYKISVVFTFVNGISVGAPVRYAGVTVGEVQEINVYFDEKENRPMINVLIWVSHNTWINEDAAVTINTLGLLGEKYLEITPGTRETRLLEKGDTIRGRDPVSTEELTRDTQSMLLKIEDVIKSIDQIVGDRAFRESIKNTAYNIESLTASFQDLVNIAKDGNGTMGRLLSDDSLYRHLDEMVLEIKEHPWKLLYKPKEKR
ncbi:MAG TPA: MCE family protein [Candidatus Omnitrophica bacterium]|jgi:phospholipid/cholesterol/gamma-HCH transport system substrate-binding protein|nr:MCE family protein [Candidatus Omnitrophota bacterium]